MDGVHLDTLVAGAGLTGLTAAVLLARAGQSVGIVEARRVGAVTTGNTTGKLSLLQGTFLSDIRSHNSLDVLQAYVEGNREGQAWLERFLEDRGVAYQRRRAWTYAVTDDGESKLRAEFAACKEAGLPAEWADDAELPFRVKGAITLADQAQLSPLLVLDALLADFAAHGGLLAEETRLTDAETSAPIVVTTTRGKLTADRLILATGVPVLDRGGYFAKLTPLRSYATAYRVPGAIPQGMYLSADDPTRSLRTVPVGGEEFLMVGGEGHIGGRMTAVSDPVGNLEQWTKRHFFGAQLISAWSAQDYRSVNRVPFVGLMPRGDNRIYVATGFNKWGMTNAVAAGLNLSGQVLGGSMEWAETLKGRITKPVGAIGALTSNLEVAAELTKGWVAAELQGIPDQPPAEGYGVVGRGQAGKPEAISTVRGTTCRISGVCSHLGGIVQWNPVEQSWDCPLHGSRFAADGRLLEGPAVADLEALDEDEQS